MATSGIQDWPNKVRGKGRSTLRRLNDVYLLTNLSISGLLLVHDKLSDTKRRAMDVTVLGQGGRQIATTRRKKHIRPLLNRAIERTQVEYALQSVVAETEAFLTVALRYVLGAFPEKLAAHDRKIDLGAVIEADSKESLLQRLVESRIAAILYGSPSEYLCTVADILSIRIPDVLVDAFSEVKATRDLVVHAEGIVNDIYLRKARKNSRANLGQEISVDVDYLRHAVAASRDLVSYMATEVPRKFKTQP